MVAFGIGEYPPEYNANVHGPYDPARYYGKPDKKFTELKVGEVLPWLQRRSYHPLAIVRGIGRGFWRWNQAWMLPRRAGPAGLIQMSVGLSLFFYINMYPNLKYHRHCKYH